MTLHDIDVPHPAADEVLVRVVAAGVNRADLLQAAGHYPPPAGVGDVLGLEVSGTVAAVGDEVTSWRAGQPVCALLAGGGYAEYVAVPAGQVMPVPDGCATADAAALPEVACTVWSNLVMTAGLRTGETVLVHGGTSGIGTHAIQVARALGVRTVVTAGSAEKAARARALGADVAIDYRREDFVARVAQETDGRGVDVVLDVVGGSYLRRNLEALAPDGRLVVIGLQGGATAELDLGLLIAKRASVTATGLRGRDRADKAAIVAEVVRHVWPMVADGRVRPVIDARFPLADVHEAHRRLAAGEVAGKVLLDISEG